MSIAKPFTFVANTYAKASEVNANFDTVYSQVNTNISGIAQNATDIDNLENNKADINGSSAQRFAVADAITDSDAINKRSLRASIANSIDYISGFMITKDSGNPNNTIIVSAGSCYDSTKTVVLNKTNSSTKTNDNQAANATYYVYVIGNSTGSQADILISESSTEPALPSGYTLYRQIGSYTTDSNNNINGIAYFGFDSNKDNSINSILNGVTPDFNRSISIPSTWTATMDGYIYANAWVQSGSESASIYIDNFQIILNGGLTNREGAHGPSAFVPIPKGSSFRTSGNVRTRTFIPMKGAN